MSANTARHVCVCVWGEAVAQPHRGTPHRRLGARRPNLVRRRVGNRRHAAHPASGFKNFGYADFYSNSAFRGAIIQQNWEIWEANTFAPIYGNLHTVWWIRVLLYIVFFEEGVSKCGSIFLAILYKSANCVEFLTSKQAFRCNFCSTRTFLPVFCSRAQAVTPQSAGRHAAERTPPRAPAPASVSNAYPSARPGVRTPASARRRAAPASRSGISAICRKGLQCTQLCGIIVVHDSIR